ncbi:response regulator [Croceicoccus ponticola]|uniref:Response regulator n=1 Tax=Croceicoccus ponticola TaxID=2217664 RepID=A0A437GY09_9SPHN|nr:MASE1 domain-containing protein [Croceicoccus ponticola]RVQ67574.1 response regulator [Croceicoccus ponticola]
MEYDKVPKAGSGRADWFTMAVVAMACAVLAGMFAMVSLAVPHSGIFAVLWLPNAIVVGVALSIRRADFPAALAGAAIGLFTGEILGNVPLNGSLVLTAANTVEIALAVQLSRRWCGLRIDFTDPKGFFRFVGALLVAASISAVVAVVATGSVMIDGSVGPLYLARHASSLVFLGPLVMVVFATWRHRARGGTLVPMPVMAVVLAGTFMIFGQSNFPFLFLATPLVVLAGISSGIGGTSFVLVAMAAIATVATAMGSGPIVLTRGGASLQIVSLQMFLASLTLVGIPLAGLIERGLRNREALRASRDDKRRVLDNIDEVLFSITNEGRWQSLNMAWERAHKSGRPYRLVLMDMMMPELDGLEATRRLRQAGYGADMLPIVALTANCFPEDIAACREAGMQGHLGKPMQMDELTDAIDRYVHAAGTTPAIGIPTPVPATGATTEDALAVRYRARKEMLLRELAEVAAGIGSPQWDVLAMQLHKLAGTAAYFGEARLGELARSLEDRLRRAEDATARLHLVRAEWKTMHEAA